MLQVQIADRTRWQVYPAKCRGCGCGCGVTDPEPMMPEGRQVWPSEGSIPTTYKGMCSCDWVRAQPCDGGHWTISSFASGNMKLKLIFFTSVVHVIFFLAQRPLSLEPRDTTAHSSDIRWKEYLWQHSNRYLRMWPSCKFKGFVTVLQYAIASTMVYIRQTRTKAANAPKLRRVG